VDWAKKIEKSRGSDLYPGEHVEAGTYVQKRGALGKTIAWGAAGAVGAVVAGKLASKQETVIAETGAAAQLPADAAVLGLSAHRLMVFSHSKMSGKPKELVLAVPLADVAAITVEQKKLSYALELVFSDGSAAEYEAVKMAKPVEFVEAFTRLKG
jgi:hypothetical protein